MGFEYSPIVRCIYRSIRPQVSREQVSEVLAAYNARTTDWRLPQWANALAPHDPMSARRTILESIAQFCNAQVELWHSLEALYRLDKRLGIWCNCAIAETALPDEPAPYLEPYLASHAVRAWIRGVGSPEAAVDAGNTAQGFGSTRPIERRNGRALPHRYTEFELATAAVGLAAVGPIVALPEGNGRDVVDLVIRAFRLKNAATPRMNHADWCSRYLASVIRALEHEDWL